MLLLLMNPLITATSTPTVLLPLGFLLLQLNCDCCWANGELWLWIYDHGEETAQYQLQEVLVVVMLVDLIIILVTTLDHGLVLIHILQPYTLFDKRSSSRQVFGDQENTMDEEDHEYQENLQASPEIETLLSSPMHGEDIHGFGNIKSTSDGYYSGWYRSDEQQQWPHFP
ncbi:hypothetical protein GBA52_025246 [Prunus armeniaca]|nr:hypothetical protein GBA52_025246 [Prunus armeniaca]